MTKFKNGKAFALVAAILFAQYTVSLIFNHIVLMINLSHSPYPVPLHWLNVCVWIALIVMTIALFAKNKTLVIISTGVQFLILAYQTFVVAWGSARLFALFLQALAYASVIVFIFLAQKGKSVVKGIWFIPAALFFVGKILNWFVSDFFEIIEAYVSSMLLDVLVAVAFVFLGLWIKKNVALGEAAPENEQAAF